MNEGTFLKNTQGIVTGDGFKRVIQGTDLESVRDADGTILTGSTEPSREAVETNFIGLKVSNSQTDLGSLTITVPEDYDETVDKLRVRFLTASGGGADAPKLSFTPYYKRAGYALSSLAECSTAAINSSANDADWATAKIDGSSVEAGDAVTLSMSTGAHTTDDVNIYGIEVVYASDLVHYDKNDRDFS